MPSPYPLHYTIRWPFYYRRPSVKRHVDLSKMPLKATFKDIPAEQTLKVLFCGDIMVMQKDIVPKLHPEVANLISSVDALIGNCEAPLGKQKLNPQAHYGIRFYMAEEFLTGIIKQTDLAPSKWHLSITNNHTGDVGLQPALDTEHIFKELGITTLGRWKKDEPPVTVFTVGQTRFGVIAWTDWMNCEIFSEEDPVALRRKHIEHIDWPTIKKQLKIDCLIALPHWEYEFQHFPHKASQTFAKNLFEKQGIDLLVGVHTHTLQPLEKFGKGLCFYNLGNFCGLGVAWPVRMAPLLEMHIDATNGEIVGYALHVFAQVNSENNIDIVPLRLAPPKLRDHLISRLGMLFDSSEEYGKETHH